MKNKYEIVKVSAACYLYPYEYHVIRRLWFFPFTKARFLYPADALDLCKKLNYEYEMKKSRKAKK